MDEIQNTAERGTPKDSRLLPINMSDTVTVLLGPIKYRFISHKSLSIATSDFFKAALGSSWREGRSRVIELPGEEPAIFDLFQCWLYCPFIPLNDHHVSNRYWALPFVKAWVLGDQLQAPAFKNMLVDQILCKFRNLNGHPIDETTVKFAYDNTTKNSLLRQLVFDIVVAHIDARERAEFGIDSMLWDGESLSAFTAGILDCWQPGWTSIRVQMWLYDERCKYHWHGKIEPKCRNLQPGKDGPSGDRLESIRRRRLLRESLMP